LHALYRPFQPFFEWGGAHANERLWDESLAILGDRRARSSEEAFGEMVERALRAAAIDTGAIEGLYTVDRGFTMSIVGMATAWEAEIETQKGTDVAALVAAQRRGYDLALDAATSGIEISEAWIRRIHEEVCGPQETFTARTPLGPQHQRLSKGVYKDQPNHVVQADGPAHPYAPVDATPDEMHRLVGELRSSSFETAHPVLQASFAHHALAAVHPFSDGNGRVARVLASVYLLKAASVPLVVFADQRGLYLQALAAADEGRLSAFVDFVEERAVDVILLVADELRSASQPSIHQSMSRITQATTWRRAVTMAEVGSAGLRLIQQVRAALRDSVAHIPEPVAGRVTDASSQGVMPAGYQQLPHANPLATASVVLETSGVVRSVVETSFNVAVADDLDRPFPFLVVRVDPYEALPVRLEEVHPVITEAFRRRLSAWADRMVREGLSALTERVESQIQP